MTEKHLTDKRFTDLPLSDALQQGLQEAGFTLCTPIQAETLPPALQGADVAGQAQTGTGKTIAFLLACCNLLLTREPLEGHKKGEPRALILAPTRELAIQIHKDAELLNKHTNLKIGLVYGGTGYDQQKAMLGEHTDILIGTPGRLIDFYKQKLFSLEHTQVVVLDEADRMFDLGFIKDIRYLLRKMPEPQHRLNLLYSATLSFRVMELAYEHMNDPQEIKIETDEVVADKVVEYSYYPADAEKLPLLVNLVKQVDQERVLVFVNTRHAAEDVSRTLEVNGIKTAMLSGDVPQNKREKLLEEFKTGARRILVATDVAARGLHIPSVSHVYNFDLPQDAEDYVHRIGRTARAGASGEAVSFICEKYAYSIMDIEEFIGHSLPRKDIEPGLLDTIERAKRQPRKDSRGKGPRSRDGGGRDRTTGRGGDRGKERSVAKKPARKTQHVEPGPDKSGDQSPDSSPPQVTEPAQRPADAIASPVDAREHSGSDRKTAADSSLSTSTQPAEAMSGQDESVLKTPGAPSPDQDGKAASPREAVAKEVVVKEAGSEASQSNRQPSAPAPSQPIRSPSIIPANPDLPPRFSRRFGEVPAVG